MKFIPSEIKDTTVTIDSLEVEEEEFKIVQDFKHINMVNTSLVQNVCGNAMAIQKSPLKDLNADVLADSDEYRFEDDNLEKLMLKLKLAD